MENEKPQLSEKRTPVEQSGVKFWDSLIVVHHIWDTFSLVAFNVILMSFGALLIFRNLDLMITDGREHLSGYNS